MENKTYYVIKPTLHSRKKVTYGEVLELTETQARPLRHGGFITQIRLQRFVLVKL